MRTLLLCLLVVVPSFADDLWIGKFKDPETRERARTVLLNRGTPALPALRDALDLANNPALAEELRKLIAEIEKREPFGLRFSAGMPRMRLTTDLVNSPDFKYAVRVRNGSGKKVVLFGYLALRILDANGAALKPKTRRGRFGRRKGEYLEALSFVAIEPGKIWSFMDGLKLYMHDPEVVVGWHIPGPGVYTLEFTYHYDRAATKKRNDPKWKPLHDPEKPWNQALELKHVFRTQMRVG